MRANGDWQECQEQLQIWYQSSAYGQQLRSAVSEALTAALSKIFGYQGVQIGQPFTTHDLLNTAGLSRHTVFDGSVQSGKQPFRDDVTALPLASGSMNVVLLAHILEFTQNPHQVLREACRVMDDSGTMVLLMFNPHGWFGVKKNLVSWRARAPWSGHFYGRQRVQEWLSVLNFQTERVVSVSVARSGAVGFAAPWLATLGPAYILVARKRTQPLTPARPGLILPRAKVIQGVFAGAQRGQRRVVED